MVDVILILMAIGWFNVMLLPILIVTLDDNFIVSPWVGSSMVRIEKTRYPTGNSVYTCNEALNQNQLWLRILHFTEHKINSKNKQWTKVPLLYAFSPLVFLVYIATRIYHYFYAGLRCKICNSWSYENTNTVNVCNKCTPNELCEKIYLYENYLRDREHDLDVWYTEVKEKLMRDFEKKNPWKKEYDEWQTKIKKDY